MGLKVTYKEWIMLIVMAATFVSITAFLITFFFDVSGPIVVTIVLVGIFLIFKLYQFNKGDGDDKVDYMGEDSKIN
ncbi:MAG: hypothetical protein V5A66_05355 [Candidatus Thermoplasmatota archaeon]